MDEEEKSSEIRKGFKKKFSFELKLKGWVRVHQEEKKEQSFKTEEIIVETMVI